MSFEEDTTEAYLIDRFNERYTIDDIVKRDRTGMINASLIGRPERTASVGVTKDGQHFTDFGAGATREDGTQDGGDAFEFYIRFTRRMKSEVLRELGQQENRQARDEILRAARAGELPSSEVMRIITPTGRAVYNENAKRSGHPTLEEREAGNGGAGGFSKAWEEVKQGTHLPWQVEEQSKEQGIPEGFITGNTPCEQCGCLLYRHLAGYTVCVRCYPPRGYHLYSDLIDARYPRTKRP